MYLCVRQRGNRIELGPQCSLKLWWLFEMCLGTTLSLRRSDIILPILEHGKPESRWFILKEGCYNSLKFFF
ncbi:hypothetical protein Hanom_Chr06g00480921 [Helianthus anomalus]